KQGEYKMSQVSALLKRPAIARPENEVFDEDGGGYRMWRRGQITQPQWIDRQSGCDFITIRAESNLADLEKYLSASDKSLRSEYYNLYSTGHDKNGNRMVFLYDQDENGDNKKVAIICILAR